MAGSKSAQSLREQALGRNDRQAIAAPISNSSPYGSIQETSDGYHGVIARLCARHRVIVCKDDIQWILQRRKKGGAERPWRGVGYFRTRDALIRLSHTVCGRIDPAAMAILLALPGHIGGVA